METVQKLIDKGFNVEFRVSKTGKYLCIVSCPGSKTPLFNASGENMGSASQTVVSEAESYEMLINNLPFDFSGLINSTYWSR